MRTGDNYDDYPEATLKLSVIILTKWNGIPFLNVFNI